MSASDDANDWARAVDIQEGLNQVKIDPNINYSNPTMSLNINAGDQNDTNKAVITSNQVSFVCFVFDFCKIL
jgi:hypothetical protein